jgi:hypothetical protein
MIFKTLGYLVVMASLFFFAKQLGYHTDELKLIFSSYQSSPADLTNLFIYIFVIVNGGVIWHLLMKSYVDFNKPILESMHIFLTTQIAKYLPGNIGHHAGRIYLAKKHNYKTLQILSTMVVENLLPITTSCLFSIYLITRSQINIDNQVQFLTNFSTIIIASSIMAFLLVNLIIFRKKIIILLKKHIDPKIRLRNVFFSLVLTLFNFLALGLILFNLIKSHASDAPTDFFLITSIFAISWLLGFITPGSPGGIGIREALLVTFLAPIYGNAIAIWLSIVLRIITTLGDGIAFLIGISLTPFVKRLNVKNT